VGGTAWIVVPGRRRIVTRGFVGVLVEINLGQDFIARDQEVDGMAHADVGKERKPEIEAEVGVGRKG
jgi:translation elongation factor EF-Ts